MKKDDLPKGFINAEMRKLIINLLSIETLKV